MQQDRDTEIAAKSYHRISGGREGDRYELASKTPRTWRRYTSSITMCEEIADEKGLVLYPVDPATGKPAQVDPDTLKTMFRCIIEERDGAVGSIHVAKQALSLLAYRLRGHPPPDWTRLTEFFRGVKREKGGPRRQARPLRAADLEAILARLDPTNPRDARDGFLLMLGWAAALRSDELVTRRAAAIDLS